MNEEWDLGYSNIFAAGLAFSVLLGIFYVLYDRLPKEVVDLDSGLSEKYEDLGLRTATVFSVQNVTYFSDSSSILCHLLNMGSAILDPNDISIIIDGEYIDETVHTVNRRLGSDLRNPGLWDCDESLELNLTFSLDPGDHVLKLFYENGVWTLAQIDVFDQDITWTVSHTDPQEGTVNESCDITGVGVGEDSGYVYFRMNLSGDLSDECTYTWYVDIDGNGSTGMKTEGSRTLLEYPGGATQSFPDGAGIEYLISYHDGSATLLVQGDLDSMLEEHEQVSYYRRSTTSLVVRVVRSDLGFLPTDSVSFSFYAFSADYFRRVDFAPDP